LNVLRRVGYSFQKRLDGELSFVKRVGNADYPRFHIYARTDQDGGVHLNLHVDQKRASYEGATAHSGEYSKDSNEQLERELEKIKNEFER